MDELSGRKALLIEDEAGISILIEDMLHDLGCQVVGSATRIGRACELARTATCDFAIVDVNLDGEPAYPAAHILRQRQIPFVFSTGYGASGIPAEFADCGLLSKPFLIGDLRREILAALGLGVPNQQ